MAMEAPLFFRRPELTPPLSLPDERRLADAGELDDLRVGMVLKQSHCMVKLQDRQRYLCRHHHRCDGCDYGRCDGHHFLPVRDSPQNS